MWTSIPYSFIWLINSSQTEIIISIFIMFLLGVNQSAFLHRSWTHKAWTPSTPINILALFFHTVSLFGPSYGWICVHRKHHLYSDTPKDPHSPKYMSRYKIFFWPYFNKIESKFIIDLVKDKYHVFFFKHYWKINIIWLLIMYSCGVLYLWLASVGLILLCIHLIGAWLHKSPFSKDEGPGNSIFNSLFAWNGEAWHKNHHDEPTNWNFSKEWWQFDMSAMFIRIMVLLRLAKFEKNVIGKNNE